MPYRRLGGPGVSSVSHLLVAQHMITPPQDEPGPVIGFRNPCSLGDGAGTPIKDRKSVV